MKVPGIVKNFEGAKDLVIGQNFGPTDTKWSIILLLCAAYEIRKNILNVKNEWPKKLAIRGQITLSISWYAYAHCFNSVVKTSTFLDFPHYWKYM